MNENFAHKPPPERLKINEIFYSIQGESSFAGRPCVLIRLTGCQMRCVWCDSEYSFYEGDWMTIESILDQVHSFECPLVEVTGGEPLLQPSVYSLMSQLCDEGFEVLLETGGGIPIDRVDPRVHRIMDLKAPGSGEFENNHWPNLEFLNSRDELKMVIADRTDYLWARDLVKDQNLTDRCRAVLLSPVDGQLKAARLASWILEDRLPVRFQTQLHKYLWPEAERGV